jgi:hypothetical protein
VLIEPARLARATAFTRHRRGHDAQANGIHGGQAGHVGIDFDRSVTRVPEGKRAAPRGFRGISHDCPWGRAQPLARCKYRKICAGELGRLDRNFQPQLVVVLEHVGAEIQVDREQPPPYFSVSHDYAASRTHGNLLASFSLFEQAEHEVVVPIGRNAALFELPLIGERGTGGLRFCRNMCPTHGTYNREYDGSCYAHLRVSL